MRKIPQHAGNLAELLVHRGDQIVFVFAENGPPLIFGLQIDEVFGIEKSRRVGAVVGAADLGNHLLHLGKRGED